jgi:hypothetical protein
MSGRTTRPRSRRYSVFVRKRASGNQLLESYRDPETGKPKHRVICNLGKHGTPEEALEGAREELDALLHEARREEIYAEALEWTIKNTYSRGLDLWHGGEIPTIEEVLTEAQEAAKSEVWGDGDPYADAFDVVRGFDTRGLAEFIGELRRLYAARERAHAHRESTAPQERKLREKIALLEDVVSKKGPTGKKQVKVERKKPRLRRARGRGFVKP